MKEPQKPQGSRILIFILLLIIVGLAFFGFSTNQKYQNLVTTEKKLSIELDACVAKNLKYELPNFGVSEPEPEAADDIPEKELSKRTQELIAKKIEEFKEMGYSGEELDDWSLAIGVALHSEERLNNRYYEGYTDTAEKDVPEK